MRPMQNDEALNERRFLDQREMKESTGMKALRTIRYYIMGEGRDSPAPTLPVARELFENLQHRQSVQSTVIPFILRDIDP